MQMKTNIITIKQAFDNVFKDVKFDKSLFSKIQSYNLEYITKDDEQKNLFGSQLLGCYKVKFTLYEQSKFFKLVYDIDDSIVTDAAKSITTINQSFKISSDVINLTIFYTVYRFLNNKEIKDTDREKYAIKILNFFSYRTLVIISSNYFIYPISEQEALSLLERLSYKYIIKKVRNWKEYCIYRSNEFVKSKYFNVLKSYSDDDEIVNSINDLYSRTKDTIKNIYKEFIIMNNSNEGIKNNKSTVKDVDGKEVLNDRINSPDSYYDKLLTTMVDKNHFIKQELIDITIGIVKNTNRDDLNEFLDLTLKYAGLSKSNYDEVTKIMHDFIIFLLTYLNDNKSNVSVNDGIISILNKTVGVILYSRSNDPELNRLKDKQDKLIIVIYKSIAKKIFPNRKLLDLRNAYFIYICLRTFLDNKK